MKHPLIEYATTRPYRSIPQMPTAAQYDVRRGMWLHEGTPLVEMCEFRSAQVTKKCDQETGEDQKGE